jgi:hypothetical protein
MFSQYHHHLCTFVGAVYDLLSGGNLIIAVYENDYGPKKLKEAN